MIHRIAYNNPNIDSFDHCLDDCLETLRHQEKTNSLLGVVFFIDAETPGQFYQSYHTISTAVEEKGMHFPYNVLAQAGCCPVSMEMWLDTASLKTEYLSYKGIRYTRFSSDTGISICGMGLCHNDKNADIHEQADETFRLLVDILQQEGLSLSDIVRQWNYVPGILDIEETQGKAIQHYQVFNEVRKHWYSKALFTDGYPAATGIGVKTGPFTIDFIAFPSSAAVKKTGLYNPKQVNAYQYTQQQLVGETLHGKQKNPPLFERAKLLDLTNKSSVIVSGTAAILGQETVGIGDACKQTEVTIKNMMELISPLVTQNEQIFHFKYIRVYIKEIAHRDAIMKMCDTYFPGVQKSFVLADVCRDNLLMEIEGEAEA